MEANEPTEDPRRELFDRVCLSCLSYLDTFEECSSVVFDGYDKASSHELDVWEKKNLPYQLPEDMKSFYRMFDGFTVSFGVETGSPSNLPVGTMHLCPLKAIKRLPLEGQFPGIADISTMTSAAFLLDDSMEDGNIVLFYRTTADRELCVVSSDGLRGKDSKSKVGIGKSGSTNSLAAMTASTMKPVVDSGSTVQGSDKAQGGFENPEIWFQDRSARWHFVSRTFSDFLRVMVVHLGIDGWAMAFAPEGVSPLTRQYMGIFNRERLCLDVSVKL